MTESAPRRFRARLAAGGLMLLAIWEVMVLVSARQSEPSPEDWLAVGAAITATRRDDRLILFAPRWLDPLGRKWLGDRMSLDHVARMDTARFGEVWEVSVRGASAPEVGHEPAVSEQRFGPLLLRRFVRDAPIVTWSLTDGARICEIDFEPRRGVLLDLHHRFDQAQRVFRQVELGDQLQVYAGLADYKKRSNNQSKALIQVIVDERVVTRGFAGNDEGWVALPMAATTSGAHDVEIVASVHEPKGTVDLWVCVAAEARVRRR